MAGNNEDLDELAKEKKAEEEAANKKAEADKAALAGVAPPATLVADAEEAGKGAAEKKGEEDATLNIDNKGNDKGQAQPPETGISWEAFGRGLGNATVPLVASVLKFTAKKILNAAKAVGPALKEGVFLGARDAFKLIARFGKKTEEERKARQQRDKEREQKRQEADAASLQKQIDASKQELQKLEASGARGQAHDKRADALRAKIAGLEQKMATLSPKASLVAPSKPVPPVPGPAPSLPQKEVLKGAQSSVAARFRANTLYAAKPGDENFNPVKGLIKQFELERSGGSQLMELADNLNKPKPVAIPTTVRVPSMPGSVAAEDPPREEVSEPNSKRPRMSSP